MLMQSGTKLRRHRRGQGYEGVEEMAKGGGSGDAQLSAAAVHSVQSALGSGMQVGGGGCDAGSAVENDAEVAIAIRNGDRGAT